MNGYCAKLASNLDAKVGLLTLSTSLDNIKMCFFNFHNFDFTAPLRLRAYTWELASHSILGHPLFHKLCSVADKKPQSTSTLPQTLLGKFALEMTDDFRRYFVGKRFSKPLSKDHIEGRMCTTLKKGPFY